MVDFTYTQAQAKEVALPASCEGGQIEAAVAKPMSTSPQLTADGVKMYHQLMEIHAIATTQLEECARWHRSNSTPSSVWVGTGRPRPVATLSTIRLAPSPQLISHPRPCYGGRTSAVSPRPAARLARVAWAYCRSTVCRNMFEKSRGIATQRTTIYKAVMPHPAQGSREVTPSSAFKGPQPLPTATIVRWTALV
jgi:hypothetical protein